MKTPSDKPILGVWFMDTVYETSFVCRHLHLGLSVRGMRTQMRSVICLGERCMHIPGYFHRYS